MGLSQNEKEEDLKRLEDLTNSVVQNRGTEKDYSLRALMEFEHLSKDCSIAKSYIPKSIDNSNIRTNLIVAGFIWNQKLEMLPKLYASGQAMTGKNQHPKNSGSIEQS